MPCHVNCMVPQPTLALNPGFMLDYFPDFRGNKLIMLDAGKLDTVAVVRFMTASLRAARSS